MANIARFAMKYKHTEETTIILDDLVNRVQQLIEASEKSLETAPQIAEPQIQAFQAVITLLEQCRRYGHVFRGSSHVPDGLLPYVTTASYKNPLKVLGKNERLI